MPACYLLGFGIFSVKPVSQKCSKTQLTLCQLSFDCASAVNSWVFMGKFTSFDFSTPKRKLSDREI